MSSIADEIKQSFRSGSILTKLIYVNIGIFLIVQIINVIMFLGNIPGELAFLKWFMVPADLSNLLVQPWSLVTYMFLHEGLLHILFNMLFLY